MKKLEMIALKVFALFWAALGFVYSPSASADGATKAPSMEETIGFMRDRLVGCGDATILRWTKSGDGYNSHRKNNIKYSKIDIQGNKFIAETIQSYYDRTDYTVPGTREPPDIINVTKQVIISFDLAELSPEVGLVAPDNVFTTNYLSVAVNCAKGNCINIEVNGKHETKRTTEILTCNDSDAQRIGKALIHAINLAGGKKPLF